jgi:hypothetical protein
MTKTFVLETSNGMFVNMLLVEKYYHSEEFRFIIPKDPFMKTLDEYSEIALDYVWKDMIEECKLRSRFKNLKLGETTIKLLCVGSGIRTQATFVNRS